LAYPAFIFVENYKTMDRKDHGKILKLTELYESYPIDELERIAIRANKRGDEEELEAALHNRQWKLNQTLEWTAENKEKLLRLNGKLINCFGKLKTEARALCETLLCRRRDVNDDFLHDFEIEAKVKPFVFAQIDGMNTYEFESGIYDVLDDDWNDFMNLKFSINKEDLNEGEILYLNQKQNWNTDHWFKGQFDNHFISQGIHDLYDHTNWSFHDILKINYLGADLVVRYQHFMEF
jgi:hypothetical protein